MAKLYGLSNAINHFCFAVQGEGGDEKPCTGVLGGSEERAIEFTEKQLQKKFKHAKFFGVDSSWSQTAAQEYKQAILRFIDDEATEIMEAFYRKKAATYYINKTTRVFVVKVDGVYKMGWRLSENQLENFLRSGNLS